MKIHTNGHKLFILISVWLVLTTTLIHTHYYDHIFLMVAE